MSNDERDEKGLSRRGFLRGLATLGAASAVGSAATLSSGCALLATDIGPIEIRHPSWHNDSTLRADASHPVRLKVASYNVAHWKGRSGDKDVERVADVLEEIDPDVVALQETDMGRVRGRDQTRLDYLAERLGHQVVTVPDEQGDYTYRRNAMLTRFPLQQVRFLDLSLPGRDPRGLIDVEVVVDGQVVRVIGTHFGLDADERAHQITQMLNWLYAFPKHRGAVVMGDFNEWFGQSYNFRFLERYLGPSRGPSTFPSHSPIFHLDRIWTNPVDAIKKVRVPKNSRTEAASDHLPIWALVEM